MFVVLTAEPSTAKFNTFLSLICYWHILNLLDVQYKHSTSIECLKPSLM
jgi:hypothetical protein